MAYRVKENNSANINDELARLNLYSQRDISENFNARLHWPASPLRPTIEAMTAAAMTYFVRNDNLSPEYLEINRCLAAVIQYYAAED